MQNRLQWFYGGQRKGMCVTVRATMSVYASECVKPGGRGSGRCWIRSLKYRVPNAPGQKLWTIPSGGMENVPAEGLQTGGRSCNNARRISIVCARATCLRI